MWSLRAYCTLVVAFGVGLSRASFCGEFSIPFSFEVAPDGQPVVGCARPSCFGWAPNGLPLGTGGSFYKINNRPDGFMRKDVSSIPPFSQRDPRYYQTQQASCEPTFQSAQCAGDEQWVGGVAPLLNVSSFPMVLQCCRYEPLRLSTDRGVAVVNPGQIVVGGEVYKNDRQYAFDYVKDVLKHVNADGTVYYDVSIRRLPCLPVPDANVYGGQSKSEKSEQVDLNRAGPFYQFQAPISEVNGAPLAPPTGADLLASNGISNGLQTQTIAQNGLLAQSNAASAQPLGGQVQNGFQIDTVAQPGLVPQQTLQQAPAQSNSVLGETRTQGFVEVAQAQPGFVAQQVLTPVQQPAVFVPSAPAQPAAFAPAAFAPAAVPAVGGLGIPLCFSGDTEVDTLAGRKRMDQITTDDWLLSTGANQTLFSRVEFWLHRVPSQVAEFREIHLEDGSRLKITDKHFIYKTQCNVPGELVEFDEVAEEAVTADEVQADDCLYTLDYEHNKMREQRVLRVERVTETGIYAPMTDNGKLFVNGVLASCHNIVQSHSLQLSYFSSADIWQRRLISLFGYDSDDLVELPWPTHAVLSMLDLVLPKGLVTL